MAGRVDAEMLPEALVAAMTAVLDSLEVLPHRLGAPRAIASQVGNLIPVRIARRDQDHRVVRRATAQGPGARIPDAVVFGQEVRIPRLLHGIAVVADEEVPTHAGVFCRERMEGRNVVLGRFSRPRVAPGFEHEHGKALVSQPRRHGSTAGSRADDDVVGVSVGLVGEHARSGGAGDDERLDEIAAIHAVRASSKTQ
jgi:hypothetical protein